MIGRGLLLGFVVALLAGCGSSKAEYLDVGGVDAGTQTFAGVTRAPASARSTPTSPTTAWP
jgi:hypothetical protein